MPSTPDASIAAIARRQHGVFTVRQAASVGLSRRQISRRLDAGRWRSIAPGTYLIEGVPHSWLVSTMAAHLARTASVVSHQSAACLWGLDLAVPPRPTLTVPPTASARTAIASIHRRPIRDHEHGLRNGFDVTAPARTLVDLVPLLGPAKGGALLDQALHLRITSVAEVCEQAETVRAPQLRRHVPQLLRRLRAWVPEIAPESVAEARLLRLLGDWGVPTPDRQIAVHDERGRLVGRIDVGWPRHRLGLEYDSGRWHGPDAWARDQRRHDEIVRLGWQLIHVDAADLRPGRPALRDRLRRELARASAA